MAARVVAALSAAVWLCACVDSSEGIATNRPGVAGAISVTPIQVAAGPEPCVLEGAAPPPKSAAWAAWELRCGAWEAPAATVLALDAAAPEALLADEGWRARLAEFADCAEAARPTPELGGPSAALACSVTAGRWPYHAFAVRRCDRGFLLDGVAAALPSVLDALDRLCGGPGGRRPAGAYAAEIAALEAELGAASYGPDDIERFDSALRLAQLRNFAELYASSGELYRELLDLQERAIRERPDLANAAPYGGLGFLYMHIALELSNLGAFQRAEAWFEDADALLERESPIARAERARLMSYQALHLGNLGRIEEALRQARAATELRRRLVEETAEAEAEAAAIDPGVGALRGDMAQSRVIEAAVLEQAGDPEGARRALAGAREALAADPSAPRHWAPQAYLIEARLHETGGEKRAALAAVEAAIDEQRALLPASRTEAVAQFARSRLLKERGLAEEAARAFAAGLQALREADATLTPDDALPAMRLTQARIDDGEPRAGELRAVIFELAQRVREPVVASTLARVAAGFAPESPQAVDALRTLESRRREATLLDEAVARATADPETLAFTLDDLRKRAAAAREAEREAARAARAASPGYERLVDERVALDALQDALRPGEAFASILVGQTGSFVVFVDARGVETYPVPLGARALAERVEALTGPLRADPVAPLSRAWADRSAGLYDALFSPVRARLEAAGRLTVAPTGPLLALPFDILLVSNDGPLAPERMPWLARRAAIAVAASPSSFVKLRTRTQPSRGSRAFIGFGDFQPSGDAEAVLRELDMPLLSCRPQAERIASLDRLPATRREVERIAAAFESRPRVGTAFNETALKADPEVREARILYLATHGLLRRPFDCLPEPALVMSASPGEDGVLTATEAANLALDADLVVLSACDTAGGGGEALSGLARAFFVAGSRAVLASHWPVFDEETAELMTATFERFRAEGDAVAALQAAKLIFIEDPGRAHPVYWGAFSLIGG